MNARDNDVLADLGCPRCGERDADHLEIHEDETVRCLTCGLAYGLSDPENHGDHEMN